MIFTSSIGESWWNDEPYDWEAYLSTMFKNYHRVDCIQNQVVMVKEVR